MSLCLGLMRPIHSPRRLISILCWAIVLAPCLPRSANAQAVGAATAPMGDTNPEDQPLPGQQLGTNLTLNQGVQAINAENESFNRYAIDLQMKGGAETNFFGTETHPVTAAFTDISANLGLLLHNSKARFFALYQPAYNYYPQYAQIDNYQQTYFQSLDYNFSTRATFSWDATAARYLSFNQFLPPSLSIGSIGVVVPTLQTQLLENSYESSNVATAFGWRYLMSARSTFTASLTSSWFLFVPAYVANASSFLSERFMASGGDFKYLYQLNLRDSIGVEATPVYLYGLNPTGHNVDETLELLYQRQLSPTWSTQFGAGPLFIQSSGTFGGSSDTSYAINAGVTHLIRKSQLALTYQRAFIVGFLQPAQALHQINFNSHTPIARNWVVTSNFLYIKELGSAAVGSGDVYGGSGQVGYVIAPRLILFAQASRFSQSFNFGQPVPYAFAQNQMTAGLRFSLGSPNTHGGVQ